MSFKQLRERRRKDRLSRKALVTAFLFLQPVVKCLRRKDRLSRKALVTGVFISHPRYKNQRSEGPTQPKGIGDALATGRYQDRVVGQTGPTQPKGIGDPSWPWTACRPWQRGRKDRLSRGCGAREGLGFGRWCSWLGDGDQNAMLANPRTGRVLNV